MEGDVKVGDKYLEVISTAVKLKESRNIKMTSRSRMKLLKEYHALRKEEHVTRNKTEEENPVSRNG